ncbi:terminase small subunit [Bradyrhizobium diazoefficiens]|uniref:terminase small subunit n=1 Tax=Bradyrhizobium diazoefficiens TaxID=1355477 RepID=UPI0019099716|nr:terminase small subunit [Bradyrhizobium diazoefficiens]QQO37468.1 terminase small subunit [Bradyrhizobium diazoefficiens]
MISAKNAEKPLKNAKHEAVLQAYVADPQRVGFKAYLVVYPKSSDAAAKTGFSRLLKNADFARRLRTLADRVTEKVVERAVITTEQVLEELAKIGFANMADYSAVTRLDLSDITREQAAAISSVAIEIPLDGDVEEQLEPQAQGGELRRRRGRDAYKVTFKLHDKRAALVDIGTHLGMFEKKLKVDAKLELVPVVNLNASGRSKR